MTLFIFWKDDIETSNIVWSSDNASVVVSGLTSAARHYDILTGDLIVSLDSGGYTTPSLAWHPNALILVTAGNRLEIEIAILRVWDMEENTLITEFQGCYLRQLSYHHSALAWSPDGTMLACTSEDGKLYLWDMTTYELLDVYAGYEPLPHLK